MLERGKILVKEDVYSLGILSEAWFALSFFESTLPSQGFVISYEPHDYYAEDREKDRVISHLPDFLIENHQSPVKVAVEVTISPDLNGKRRQRKVMRAHVDTHFVELQIPLDGLEDLNSSWNVILDVFKGKYKLPLKQDEEIGPLLLLGLQSLHVTAQV